MAASRKQAPDEIRPIHVICGSDAFLRREALTAITQRVLGGADEHLAFSDHDGDTAGLADVLDDLRTPPFLAEQRLVVVANADAFVSKHRKALEDYVASPSDCGVLVLVCRSFPSNTRLAKAAARVGRVESCEPLKPRAMTAWLTQRAEGYYQKRLDGEAAALLRRTVGDSLGQLDSELSKLTLYVGQRTTIKVEDVQAMVGHHREEKVFGILDAIGQGDTAAALDLWQQVWTTDRAAPARAVGGMAWSVRQLLEARIASDRGHPMPRSAFLLPQGGRTRFSARALEDQLVNLLDTDIESKTGAGTVQSAVQRFIVAWCLGEAKS
jgi:DNA polymerase-3 subunit delta